MGKSSKKVVPLTQQQPQQVDPSGVAVTVPVKKSHEDMNFPFVSVITPTYNRRRFIPYLIQL